MNLGGFLNEKAQQPLPPAFLPHEAELYSFQKSCQTLMNKILDLFAIGLEVLLPSLSLPLQTRLTPQYRSPPQPKAQNGSRTVTGQNQHPALYDFYTTHLSPET